MNPLNHQEKVAKFERVAKKHLPEAYRVSLYLVNDRALAEVITKKAFMKMFENMGDLKESLYLPYLIRCVKEQAISAQTGEKQKGECDGKET